MLLLQKNLNECDRMCVFFYCRINTPKKQGGLGPMNIPLISDPKRTIAQDYGVLKADEGISFRYICTRKLDDWLKIFYK